MLLVHAAFVNIFWKKRPGTVNSTTERRPSSVRPTNVNVGVRRTGARVRLRSRRYAEKSRPARGPSHRGAPRAKRSTGFGFDIKPPHFSLDTLI
jgi:hypothetical protein